jgi:hypothetical protein
MAIRVTTEEVLEIMDSDVVISSTQATAMIRAASLMIDKIFADDSDVTAEELIELERWLSAHMIASTLARMASKEKVGEAEVTYTGKWGELLKSTPYGQMVLLLDTTGKIANAGKAKASMYAIPNFDE